MKCEIKYKCSLDSNLNTTRSLTTLLIFFTEIIENIAKINTRI